MKNLTGYPKKSKPTTKTCQSRILYQKKKNKQDNLRWQKTKWFVTSRPILKQCSWHTILKEILQIENDKRKNLGIRGRMNEKVKIQENTTHFHSLESWSKKF